MTPAVAQGQPKGSHGAARSGTGGIAGSNPPPQGASDDLRTDPIADREEEE